MVMDSGWDNGGGPPPRPGLSVFGKVLIGCGAAALCFVLAIVVLVWLVVSKTSSALDQGWAQMRQEVQSLQTEEGARRLYRDNPGLKDNYPTEEEFLKASAEWRSKLSQLPEKRPEIRQLMRGRGPGHVSIQTRDEDGRRTTSVRIKLDTGSTFMVETQDDKLVDIQVE